MTPDWGYVQEEDNTLGGGLLLLWRRGEDIEWRYMKQTLTTVAAMDLTLRTAFQEFSGSGLSTRLASTSASLYLAGFFLASLRAAIAVSLGSVGSAPASRPTR